MGWGCGRFGSHLFEGANAGLGIGLLVRSVPQRHGELLHLFLQQLVLAVSVHQRRLHRRIHVLPPHIQRRQLLGPQVREESGSCTGVPVRDVLDTCPAGVRLLLEVIAPGRLSYLCPKELGGGRGRVIKPLCPPLHCRRLESTCSRKAHTSLYVLQPRWGWKSLKSGPWVNSDSSQMGPNII